MSLDFSDKVVIISGSSSGIGQAAAVLFSRLGASVTIHGRSEERLKNTLNLILGNGVPQNRVLIVKGSITDSDVQKALIEKSVQKFGKIDVLVNNAGSICETGQRTMEEFDACINLTLKVPIAITELAIPYLEKTKGCIVNVSSISSMQTFPNLPFDGIAKAGLDHFTRNYAAILAPKGIRINNVNPGMTDTPALSQMCETPEETKQMTDFYISQIPLGRPAKPEEMAQFLAFVTSDKASYMTGQNVVVDGGAMIHLTRIKFD
uniref:Uncharacterized protein n=1 Tax=Panagrolaimus davidi TaxID=227884 RepID=A0A914PNT0_9BILA